MDIVLPVLGQIVRLHSEELELPPAPGDEGHESLGSVSERLFRTDGDACPVVEIIKSAISVSNIIYHIVPACSEGDTALRLSVFHGGGPPGYPPDTPGGLPRPRVQPSFPGCAGSTFCI